jgi:hypothetical protein
MFFRGFSFLENTEFIRSNEEAFMKKVALLLSVVFFVPLLAAAFLVASSSEAYAAVDVICFNDVFQRKIGVPQYEKKVFPGIAGTATVKVYNGDGSGWLDRANIANVLINGKVLFRSTDFIKRVKYLQAQVNLLEGNNTVDVNLLGMPGVRIRVEIVRKVEGEAAAMVGSAGGLIQVNDPNSPVYGVKLTIPPNALDEPKTIIIKQSIHAGYQVDLEPANLNFKKFITLELPYKFDLSEEETILAKFYDEASNFHDFGDIIEHDKNKKIIKVLLLHFSGAGADKASFENITINTNFNLYLDRFPIRNVSSLITATGGACTGISQYTL